MDELKNHGVCVVPVLSKKEVSCFQGLFNETLLDFKEYKSPTLDTIYVKGGFGGLGNPSSFHNYLVRILRMRLMASHIVKVFGELESKSRPESKSGPEKSGPKKRKLCQLIDRMSIRRKGVTLTSESWHRDETPKIPKDTDIFGGWLNLDNDNQFFSCVKGTQILSRDIENKESKGFATITPEEIEREKYEKRKSKIKVPSGHCIIFYQNIVHEVLKVKYDKRSVKLYVGWALTNKEIIDYSDAIKNNGVVQIPSKQFPPMYAKMDLNFRMKDLIQWSKDTFYDKDLEHKVGKGKIKEYRIIPRFMKSLKEMGYELYEPYDDMEIEILKPNTIWIVNPYGKDIEVSLY